MYQVVVFLVVVTHKLIGVRRFESEIRIDINKHCAAQRDEQAALRSEDKHKKEIEKIGEWSFICGAFGSSLDAFLSPCNAREV